MKKRKKKGCFGPFLLTVLLLIGLYKAVGYFAPSVTEPMDAKIAQVRSSLKPYIEKAKNSVGQTVSEVSGRLNGSADPVKDKSGLRFENETLELSETEPVRLRLLYDGDPESIRYSIDGDSLEAAEQGPDGVTVTPIRDGVTTVTAAAPDGQTGSCVVTVALYQDLLTLIEADVFAAAVSCGSIEKGTVRVTNNSDRTASFRAVPGTYMMASGNGYQNMMIMTAIRGSLGPGESRTYSVDTCCMNIHRDIPSTENTFSLGYSQNETLCALAEYCHDNRIDYAVRQAATWILTDHASYRDCQTLRYSNGVYAISEQNYRDAEELVNRISEELEAQRLAEEQKTAQEERQESEEQTVPQEQQTPEEPQPDEQTQANPEGEQISAGQVSAEEQNASGVTVRYDIGTILFPGTYYLSVPESYRQRSDEFDLLEWEDTENGTVIRVCPLFRELSSIFEALPGEDMAEAGATVREITVAGCPATQYVAADPDQEGTEQFKAMYEIRFDDAASMCTGFLVEISGNTFDSVAGDGILAILNTLQH